MSAAVKLPAGDADAERAKIEAERQKTLIAQDELIALTTAKFDGLMATLREITLGEQPGVAFDPTLRQIDEEARKLHHLVQHRLNLPERWAREDTEPTKPAVALRKTEDPHRVRWNMLATPLLRAMGVDSPFGPDDERLLDHALLVELKIGEDMPVEGRAAEAFRRLTRHAGSFVDSDLALDVVEREGGVVQQMGLMGRRLPPIPMPDDEAGQRLHTKLQMFEHRALSSGLAMAAVVACTGRRPSWQHRPSLAEMADTAGYPRVPVPFARAGDVVLAGDPDRLGVVFDAGRAAFVGPVGLVRLPITACTIAWRVG